MNKSRLVNQAKADTNISSLQTTDPKTYRALKNFSDVIQQIINGTFPQTPPFPFQWRVYLSGNPVVGNDVLDAYFRVVLPRDPNRNWTYSSILLDSCYVTAKVEGTVSTLSLDVKVSQVKGTSSWKSLFQGVNNPRIPPNRRGSHNVMFAINSLYQDDLLRLDVLAADASIQGIELALCGTYVTQEIPTT